MPFQDEWSDCGHFVVHRSLVGIGLRCDTCDSGRLHWHQDIDLRGCIRRKLPLLFDDIRVLQHGVPNLLRCRLDDLRVLLRGGQERQELFLGEELLLRFFRHEREKSSLVGTAKDV